MNIKEPYFHFLIGVLSCPDFGSRSVASGGGVEADMVAQRGWVGHAAAATCVLLIAAQTPWVVGDDATARFTVKVCPLFPRIPPRRAHLSHLYPLANACSFTDAPEPNATGALARDARMMC